MPRGSSEDEIHVCINDLFSEVRRISTELGLHSVILESVQALQDDDYNELKSAGTDEHPLIDGLIDRFKGMLPPPLGNHIMIDESLSSFITSIIFPKQTMNKAI